MAKLKKSKKSDFPGSLDSQKWTYHLEKASKRTVITLNAFWVASLPQQQQCVLEKAFKGTVIPINVFSSFPLKEMEDEVTLFGGL